MSSRDIVFRRSAAGNHVCRYRGRGSLTRTWSTRVAFIVIAFGVAAFLPQATCALPHSLLERTEKPNNDDFTSAQTVDGWSLDVTGTTAGATSELHEPDVVGMPPERSVWFRWTPDRNGRVIFDTKGSSSEISVKVYRGSLLADLQFVSAYVVGQTSRDDSDVPPRLEFYAFSGITYSISVDSMNGADPGLFSLRLNPSDPLGKTCAISSTQRPANDDFADAAPITASKLRTSIKGTISGATPDPWDPDIPDTYGGRSVWYTWTAVTTERVSFDVWQTDPSLTGGNEDLRSAFYFDLRIPDIGVFKGTSIESLENVRTSQDDSDNRVVSFGAVKGTTYSIEVVGYCASGGPFRLRLVRQQRRRNDWLRALNYYRSLAHLPPVTENPSFSYADSLHARYVAKTGQFTHVESRTSRYFTREGAIAGLSSNGYRGELGVDSISGWMGAPYHATSMLNPSLETVGYGESTDGWNTAWLFVNGETTVIDPSDYPVLWPGKNVTEPLTSYSGNEMPIDPVARCKGYPEDVGLPIVALFWGDITLRSSSFTVGGKRLAKCAYQPKHDEIFLIPKAPLMRGRTYTVRLVTSSRVIKWSFRVSRKMPSVLRSGSTRK